MAKIADYKKRRLAQKVAKAKQDEQKTAAQEVLEVLGVDTDKATVASHYNPVLASNESDTSDSTKDLTEASETASDAAAELSASADEISSASADASDSATDVSNAAAEIKEAAADLKEAAEEVKKPLEAQKSSPSEKGEKHKSSSNK